MSDVVKQEVARSRKAILIEDAHTRPMMGFEILEPVPSRSAPYEVTDPFILVHEARFKLSELRDVDTKHPHRGFDNLWYILEGSASTGHSTGPGGSIERVRLPKGGLLALRTGRGAWHAEAIGAEERDDGLGDTEWRSVLFWVNLARKDKQAEPSARVLLPDQIPVRNVGDATVRVLVGEGSPIELGTPAVVFDVELTNGGAVTIPVTRAFQGFAYLLEGGATFGPEGPHAKPPQLVLLGPGDELAVTDASPGTRLLLMAGAPYGEAPLFNGPYVD
jgi:quercetin 2,3-dioxygenase